jgi:hypothetical protein
MIQRIQSVFLFFIGVCMVVMLFMPIWTKTSALSGEMAQLNVISLSYTKQAQVVSKIPTFYIGILCVVSLVLAYISLFSFKNRMLQIKLNLANTAVIMAIFGCCAFLIFSKGEAMIAKEAATGAGKMGVGLFMPAIALIFNSLANRFIWKDEKLVRSSDRLR